MTLSARILILALPGLISTASTFSIFVGPGVSNNVRRMSVDADGNTYIAGSMSPRSYLSTAPPFQLPPSGAFVMKLDRAGSIVYKRIIEGHGLEDMAVDQDGYVYLVGGGCALPNQKVLVPLSLNGGYLAKLDLSLDRIVYSACFAAPVTAVAVTPSRSIMITLTAPAGTAALYGGNCGSEFVCGLLLELPPDADRYFHRASFAGSLLCLDSSVNCVRGANQSSAGVVRTDSAGKVYVNWSTAGVASAEYHYISVFGGGVPDPARAPSFSSTVDFTFTVDDAGNIYVAGNTTTGAPFAQGTAQSQPGGGRDVFVSKLDSTGKVFWTALIGGSGDEYFSGFTVDAAANVWVSGYTASTDFPVKFGRSDGGDFVVGLNPFASTFVFAGQFPFGSTAGPIAVDSMAMLRTSGAGGVVSSFLPYRVAPGIMGIANAANGYAGGLLAPGEVVSVYGTGLGPDVPAESHADASGLFPKSLEGVQLFIDDKPAPLLYVSESQINAVIPYGISTGRAVRVRVVNPGVSLPDFGGTAVDALPLIFRQSDGSAVLNQDGSVNSRSNPARAGNELSIFVSGGLAPNPPLADGKVASTLNAYGCADLIGPYTVVYRGAAPGAVAGICQINFLAPQVPDYLEDVTRYFVGVGANDWYSASVPFYVQP